MMFKLKAQSAKRKAKTQNLKFLVLNFNFTLFVLHFTFMGSLVFAQPISSAELINNARQYDGKIVIYAGEAIGDIMKRGDFAWANVNDGQNAIGIWINASLAKDIVYTGSYRAMGDAVEVTGIFNRACIEHGGDLDIHAQAIRKIEPGRRIQHRLNLGKRNLVIVLLGILCLIWILTLLKRK